MQLNAKIFAFVLSISLTSCIPSSGKGSKSVRKSNLTVADSNSNRNDGVSDDFGALDFNENSYQDDNQNFDLNLNNEDQLATDPTQNGKNDSQSVPSYLRNYFRGVVDEYPLVQSEKETYIELLAQGYTQKTYLEEQFRAEMNLRFSENTVAYAGLTTLGKSNQFNSDQLGLTSSQTKDNQIVVSGYCSGSGLPPANYIVYAADNLNVSSPNMSWQYKEYNSNRSCEFKCVDEYEYNANSNTCELKTQVTMNPNYINTSGGLAVQTGTVTADDIGLNDDVDGLSQIKSSAFGASVTGGIGSCTSADDKMRLGWSTPTGPNCVAEMQLLKCENSVMASRWSGTFAYNRCNSSNPGVLQSFDANVEIPDNQQNQGGSTIATGTGGTTNQMISLLKTDPMSCFKDYVMVYPWTNSPSTTFSHPMNAPTINKSRRLGTIRVGSNGGFDGAGWRVNTSQGTTEMTIYINKNSRGDFSQELSCAYGPTDLEEGCTSFSSFIPKMIYQQQGEGLNGVDGMKGYLACGYKYIACKVTKGNQDVKFNSNSDSRGIGQTFRTGEAFVMVRGCDPILYTHNTSYNDHPLFK